VEVPALRGVPASPGVGLGAVQRLAAPAAVPAERIAEDLRPAEIERALGALDAAADQLDALADRLQTEGREEDAEIVATSALMARDPGLAADIRAGIADAGRTAPEAIMTACTAQADVLAAIADETLAARADDVRSLGRRAARLAGSAEVAPMAHDVVLVAEDLGPADVAELEAAVHAIALAGGGATAHAAIVARSLGIPMVAGLGPAALELGEGEVVVVDGDSGTVLARPGTARLEAARAATRRRAAARQRTAAQRHLPAQTPDGRRIAVLANVAGAAELSVAFDAGAEGVGLLRTELAFLQARGWPTEDQHRRTLEPVMRRLGARPVTVRVLDFGGDKLPPFLDGTHDRGVALLLSNSEALAAQLRAILRASRDARARVLVPLVNSTAELDAFAAALHDAAREVGVPAPGLGPMIETPQAADAAFALAERAGFLSIGTNDLTAATLGVDRFAGGRAGAHHPRVLRAIARAVEAARHAGIPIEVCGEAAGDPIALPLLIGLGVDEISVGASRVGTVREWVRRLTYAETRELARRALTCAGTAEVEALAAPITERLAAIERGDDPALAAQRP